LGKMANMNFKYDYDLMSGRFEHMKGFHNND
jgi:hypothetical protein